MKKSIAVLSLLLFAAVLSAASTKLDVTRGLTISAAVKLDKRKPITGSGFDENKRIIYHHDIVVSRGKDFVFGRRADMWVDQLYFNFFNDDKWAVPLSRSVKTPPAGQWAVWCVTAEPFYIREEGRSGTIVTTYLNGEPEHRIEVPVKMCNSSDAVTELIGVGINGDKWGFNGEMSDLVVVDRVLSEQEIIELVRKTGKVKVAVDSRHAVPQTLLKRFAHYRSSQLPQVNWAASAMLRYAENSGNADSAARALQMLDRVSPQETPAGFAEKWNRANAKDFIICNTGKMLVMVAVKGGKSGHPVVGIYDISARREVLGSRTPAWEAAAVHQKQGKIKLASASLPFVVKDVRQDGKSLSLTAQWSGKKVIATSKINVSNARITSDLAVANDDKELRIEEIQFPKFRFARKGNGQDFLVHPRQSGVLYSNPVMGETPSPWHYPTGWLNMQFGAYYDKASGVYWSPEDPEGSYWFYSVKGRNRELDVVWSRAVPFAAGQKGGNQVEPCGNAAIELFNGNWFEAGQCYKRFVANKARWWVKELPRKSTPAWYRENVLNFSHWTFDEKAMKAMPETMLEFRKYLELPFAVHWYRWNKRGGMPDYYPKDGSLATLEKLLKSGIYVKPYFDNRLWSELDPPNYQGHKIFDAYGRRFAVKNRDGSMNYERYHKECREVVMCPGCVEWQKHMSRIVARLSSYRFSAIYHDQVAASRPFLCYDAGHGHLLNSHSAWGNGYRDMFRIIAELRKKYPELCHETEDAADTHLENFDGFLPWRWVDENQIPLFVSVYSGRAQFVGRTYNQSSRGDRESLFVKAAGQLVQNEQIGWFVISILQKDAEFARYVKQLAHIRKMFIDYFNAGEMVKPLEFVSTIPVKGSLWGTPSSKAKKIFMPQVLHSVWKHPVHGKAALLVNSGKSALTVKFKWNSGIKSITLAPRQVVVVCENENSPEARRMADELKRISNFGLWQVAKKHGNGQLKFSKEGFGFVFCDEALTMLPSSKFQMKKVALPLLHGKKIRVIGEICKFPEMSAKKSDHCVVAGFYDAKHKFNPLMSVAANVPVDGKWHTFSGEFTTPANGMKALSLFFYNSRSTGKLQVKNITVKVINQ